MTDRPIVDNPSHHAWLPADFRAPLNVSLPRTSHHLRQISAADTELDMIAVMGSQPRLWSIFGEAWGWPPATLTAEQDRLDLQRHADEMARNESFNYAVFTSGETALVGCVYIDPPGRIGADADIAWWLVDELDGSELERILDDSVPMWIARHWPFEAPRFIGRDLSWSDWISLPEIDPPGDGA